MASPDQAPTPPPHPTTGASSHAMSEEAIEDSVLCLCDLRESIHQSVSQWVPDPDVAEDLTQDCLTKVWLKAHTVEDGTKLGSWLHVLVRNEFRSWLRNQSVRRRAIEHLAITAPSCSRDPADQVISRIVAERFLARLGSLDREILCLRFLHGLPSAEVGTRVGLSPSSVRRRIMRLRERVERTALEQDGPP
jgi:RNA polymerase sigma factor (sigma-70 family)